jgi:hypothetical protein
MGWMFPGTDQHARHVGAELTNPAGGTVICDTVNDHALRTGAYLAGFFFSASAAARVQIRHRNASDTGNIWALWIDVPADLYITVPLPVPELVAESESYDAVTVSGPGAAETLQGGVWCVRVF